MRRSLRLFEAARPATAAQATAAAAVDSASPAAALTPAPSTARRREIEVLQRPIGRQPANEAERQTMLAHRARRPPPPVPLVPYENPAPPELREPLRWQRGAGVLSWVSPIGLALGHLRRRLTSAVLGLYLVLVVDWDTFLGTEQEHVFSGIQRWVKPRLAQWTTLSPRDQEKLLRDRQAQQDAAARQDEHHHQSA